MRRAQLLSVVLHAAAVLLLLNLSARLPVPVEERRRAIPLVTNFPQKNLLAASRNRDEGGGGGRNVERPVSKGNLPRAWRPFVPPVARPAEQPVLIREMAVIPMDVKLPSLDPSLVSSPFGEMEAYSPGRGSGTGLGDGGGPGIGNGRGPGVGDGDGGNGVASIGGPTTSPIVLVKVEPEFTEEARKARLQGSVVLAIEVTPRGEVANVRVMRGIGLGLDERAVEAVMKCRFRPGTRGGKPVAAPATVEIYFHLL
jgi:periplasmic protein TonB